jgi:hypothetical protein
MRAELPHSTEMDRAIISSRVLTRFSSELPREPLERTAELAAQYGVLDDADAAVDGLLSYRESR